MTPLPADPATTRLLGRSGAVYVLEEPPVASGGDAVVYRATAEDDGQRVAVRVGLVPGGDLVRQRELLERLVADPSAGPVVTPVWDHGTWQDRPFLVLDWYPNTLASWATGDRSPAERRAMALALVRAVQRLHEAGVVHGDVKPSNAMVPDGDEPAVLLADLRPPEGLGFTYGYAAPEQIAPGPPSPAADRHAVAASVWEVLAGALPDPGERVAPELRRVRAVIDASMHADPRRRPDLEVLARALDGTGPTRASPRWAMAAALVATGLSAVAAALMPATPPCPAGFAVDGETCVHPDGRALVRVEAGRFRMGRAADDDPGRLPDAEPHEVVITRPFWLGRTEITQAQWASIAGHNPVADRSQVLDGGVVAPCHSWKGHSLVGSARPVVCVSFRDVVDWLAALSRRDGLRPAYVIDPITSVITWDRAADGWRLPTEAEWEWAASAGGAPAAVCERANLRDQSAPAHWGNESPCDDGDPVLAEVGRRPPNRLGLLDLEGNALEWVWDLYGDYPTTRVEDPTGAVSGVARVLRGASWNHVPRGVRGRYAASPDHHDYTTGFRIARDVRPR